MTTVLHEHDEGLRAFPFGMTLSRTGNIKRSNLWVQRPWMTHRRPTIRVGLLAKKRPSTYNRLHEIGPRECLGDSSVMPDQSEDL